MPLRIAIDLDGVILQYKTSKEFDLPENRMPYGTFGDPVPGAKEALIELQDAGHEVVILTHRSDRSTVWSHLRNGLKIPFDSLVSPARDISYDVHVSAGGVRFTGNWTKALSDILSLCKSGTWEERKLRGVATRGLHDSAKGFL